MTRTRRIATVVCILALALAAACAGAADAPDATEPVQAASPVAPDADGAAAILGELPARLAGCSIVSGPVVYGSDALAEYLGGGAEGLLARGHQWTAGAVYAIPPGEHQVTLDIHQMRSEMAAYDFFAAGTEASAEFPAPLIGTNSYWLGAGLHVWRGGFYVHAYPASDDVALRGQVRKVAEAALESIPVPGRLPALLRILPCRGRQVGLPGYYQWVAPQSGAISDVVRVNYLEGFEHHCHFVLARSADFDAAAAGYENLVGEFYDGGAAVEPLGQVADHHATIQTTEGVTRAIMQQDNFVAVVLDSHDPEFAEALLRMSAINIRIHLLMD